MTSNVTELAPRIREKNIKDLTTIQQEFFRVTEVPLTAHLGAVGMDVPMKKAIVRTDTHEVISVVGNDYQVIQNADIFGEFDQAITASSLLTRDMTNHIEYAGNGVRTEVTYEFPAYDETIHKSLSGELSSHPSGRTGKVGDTVRLIVTARNSYDGSWMFSGGFSAIRLWCANGLASASPICWYEGKHTKHLNLELAVAKLSEGFKVYCENVELWKKWDQRKINRKTAEKVFQKFRIMKGYTSEFNEKLVNEDMERFDKEVQILGSTQWALYNALTAWSTHKEVQKRAKGNEVTLRIEREGRVSQLLRTKQWDALAA